MNKIQRLLDSLAAKLIKPINMSVVIFLGLYTVLWGLWVGNPFWTVFTTAALYHELTIMPEWAWGLIAVAVGLTTCYGAIIQRPPFVFWGAAVAGWYWSVVAVFYYVGDWHNTGGITATIFAVYGLFVYLNVRVNWKAQHKQ